MESDNTVLVVGIDFGTSGSGYAFSFRHEYKNDPLNISTYSWTGSAYKTPSSILIKPDQTFDSFGDEAEEKYKDLCDKGLDREWFFLHGFKMQLYKAVENGQDVRQDILMKDITGKKISGKLVLSYAIGYLKKHVIDQLEHRNTGVPEEYIAWVITVPAIWDDACKQFMKQSAQTAGIHLEKFALVYEPEAASIYAKSLPLERVTGDNNTFSLKSFEPGKKFIVVDGGGGTIDISAQKVAENGGLAIIHRACGGPYGGEFINQEYRRLLTKICGGEVLRHFKENHIYDYTDMMKNFETKKKTFVGKNVVVRLPVTLCDILSETTGCSFSDLVQDGSMKGNLSIKRDKLIITEKIFLSFFAESIKCIVEEITNVLKDPLCSGVSTIMMVGGFSESEIIRVRIKEAFPDKELFIPQQGGLAVLQGAVLYGHNPRIVSSRTCNYTYGVAVTAPFQQDVHDPKKLFIDNDEEMCDDIFHKCYTIDEQVDMGERRSIALTYNYEDEIRQNERKNDGKVEIYVSETQNPMYITDLGTTLHAVIHVPPPGGLWPPISHGRVELEIGGTEMIGTYIDKITGARTSTKFEFLPKQENEFRRRLYDPQNVLLQSDELDS
ncbi:unnamed protein product [Mytilus coruscus]|uniref:HSPA12A n=1 Tax=Mytilus coruscus TaxID=42192 RepID=A0A6J8CWU2_MYTCO|nr:unnamed protein product [Mytilus coruscus]